MNPFKEEPQITLTEERVIHRVTLKGVAGSAIDAFNIDRGLIYTLKGLFGRPGLMVQDFLYRGRYHYTPPFRLLLISTTLVVLLFTYSKGTAEMIRASQEGATEDQVNQVMQLFSDYFNVFLWLFIPGLSLFSWLFNRKSGYNYAENMVFQTYLMIIGNILYSVLLLEYFIPIIWLNVIYMACSFSYYVFGYRQFFGKAWYLAALELIVAYFLSMIMVFVVLAAVIISMGRLNLL